MKIIVVPDTHCRDFWKPVLKIKDKKIVFLGDYLDPYDYEGFTDEEGLENLRIIFDFARENDNVTLLVGNHCLSHIFDYYGCERTWRKYYAESHKLYRDNLDLLKPCLQVEDTLFTHAGVSKSWLARFEGDVNEKNIVSYIENEWQKAIETPKEDYKVKGDFFINSPIFFIGYCRGGSDWFGGPFWNDYRYDGCVTPDWSLYQVVGHCQQEVTGSVGKIPGLVCCDSRAIFEYDTETKEITKANFL